ncbi:hypothetical protein C4577_06345 [Candidatus Parcubacteria bacterium]|nr:MAG: hypothetical protein C4577_06345 [Candidatus Parcubacteria bacterium]
MKTKADKRADVNARALLEEILGKIPVRELEKLGHLEVSSPSRQGRVYLVPLSARGLVHVYDDREFVMSLCSHPVTRLPVLGVVLTHVLMIEGCEAEYLRTANVFALARL